MVNNIVKVDVCVICVVRATVVSIGRPSLLVIGKRILECLVITVGGIRVNGYFVLLYQVLDCMLECNTIICLVPHISMKFTEVVVIPPMRFDLWFILLHSWKCYDLVCD